MRKIKTIGLMLAATLLVPLLASAPVMAWGPERPTYTNQKPADHAVFNSITNNAAVGDERDFVRIAEKRADGSAVYGNKVTMEAEKEYEVYIYFHNDASATYNTSAHNYKGIASDVRLSSNFPDELKRGEKGTVTGKITSSDTDPKAVWDEAEIVAAESIALVYVNDSATISVAGGVTAKLSRNLFSSQGTFLGAKGLDGLVLDGFIPGCDEYSGSVVYTIRTHAVETPDPDPEPEPEPTPDPEPEEPDPEPTPDPDPEKPTPEVPTELPETGPAEIILAVVVVAALIATGVYWWRSSHAVRKATKKAKGKGKKK